MVSLKTRSKFLCAATLAILCGVAAAPIWAAEPVKTYDIQAQELAPALRAFATQSDREILFSSEIVAGKRSPGVHGSYTAPAALKATLVDTGLAYRLTGAHAFLITSQSSDAKGHFEIDAGPLDVSLQTFTAQSGLDALAPSALTSGKAAPAVSGNMSPTEVLKKLLRGSGLTFIRTREGKITLQAASGATATADSDGPVSADVSVQSQRPIQRFDPVANVDISRTIDDVQPYYIFDSQTIEDSGALNIEDFLKQRLTMNTVVQTNNQIYGLRTASSVPLGNTSSINLRGLGTNETLILVDGHRLAGVSIEGNSQQPDINGIPIAAIDRIEVLPSSAAAIYGGSAVGGVINIILKKNYNGGDIKYSYENVVRGSAPISTLDGSYGFSAEEGKTRVMMTAHYSDAQPLDLEDRQYLVERGISSILQNNPSTLLYSGLPFAGGSNPNITSNSYDQNGNQIPLTLKNGTPLSALFTSVCPGISSTTPEAALNSCLLANAGKYNFALSPGVGSYGLQQPLGYSQRVLSGMLTVRRDMSSWLEAFVELSASKNDGSSVYNPIADQGNWGVPSTSPTNPFQQDVTITLPSTLAVPLIANSTNEGATAGLTAHLPMNWLVETDYTWSRNQFSSLYYNVDDYALDGTPAFTNPPTTGVLASGALNPFVDTGAHPLNFYPYIAPVSYGSSSTLNDVALRATGPVYEFPWGSPNLAIGLEHRTESYPTNTQYDNFPISTSQDNYTTYFGQSQTTDSLYAEGTIPLITKSNSFVGVRSFELQIADRIERYSVDAGTTSEVVVPAGEPSLGPGPYHCYAPSLNQACQEAVPSNTTHYKSNNATFGFRYKPIEDVTLRASLGTAFLPPTFSQLLPNPEVLPNGDTITDPKTGATYPVNTIAGGNPNLKPEHDKNWDVGLIYQPIDGPLDGLRVDLEYYDIVQIDAIVSITGQEILSDPGLASRVTRSPTTGSITEINEALINASKYQTQGWDFSIDYRLTTSAGTFEFVGATTLIEHERRQFSIGYPSQDFVGQADEGGEVKTRATGTLTWQREHWRLGWSTRWFDSYDSDMYDAPAQGSARIPSQIYHDFLASYAFGKQSGSILSNLTIQAGIKDVFNSSPPFDAAFVPFYVSPYGDLRMRDFRLSLRKAF